eukprot:GGOE01028780.1.p1 GENE.GGOE01028780.1~~GGOE01028780.1.p1  ORF type:complete len:400 (-),score=69.31 GGOE01028780.1:1307-2398(-)
MATKAFLALSLTGGQYRHTTVRTGLRPQWNESFDFCATLPCQLIVTVHHPEEVAQVPGELCGQGVLVLRTLEEFQGDAYKTFWVPLKLTGRPAGKVCLEVLAVDMPCPDAGQPLPSHRDSSRRSFPTPRPPPELTSHEADDEHVRLLELHLEELLQTERDIRQTYDEEQAELLAELRELRARVDEAWADPTELQARVAARRKHHDVAHTLSRQRSNQNSKRRYAPLDDRDNKPPPSNATSRSYSAPHRRSEGWDSRSTLSTRPSRPVTPTSHTPRGSSVERPTCRPLRHSTDTGSVLSEMSALSSRSSCEPRARGRDAGWDPEALVPEFVWRINETGTPRQVQPVGTREMLYTASHHDSARYY